MIESSFSCNVTLVVVYICMCISHTYIHTYTHTHGAVHYFFFSFKMLATDVNGYREWGLDFLIKVKGGCRPDYEDSPPNTTKLR